jgi:hypothetical protein
MQRSIAGENRLLPAAQFLAPRRHRCRRIIRDVIHHTAEGIKGDHVPLSCRGQAGQRKRQIRPAVPGDLS